MLSSVQHVCRAATGQTVNSAAAAPEEPPAITPPESAVVLQGSWETAASRVGAAGTLASGFKWRDAPNKNHHLLLLLLLSACLPGTFGHNCNQVCQCSETNQLCHPASGQCYCAPGFQGPRCDRSRSHLYVSNITSKLKLTNISVCL